MSFFSIFRLKAEIKQLFQHIVMNLQCVRYYLKWKVAFAVVGNIFGFFLQRLGIQILMMRLGSENVFGEF